MRDYSCHVAFATAQTVSKFTLQFNKQRHEILLFKKYFLFSKDEITVATDKIEVKGFGQI